MDRIVRADQEIGPDRRELGGRGKHQLRDTLEVPLVEENHIVGERIRVHRDFRVGMRTEKARAFNADRAIAESRSFGGAGDDADVLRHSFPQLGLARIGVGVHVAREEASYSAPLCRDAGKHGGPTGFCSGTKYFRRFLSGSR